MIFDVVCRYLSLFVYFLYINIEIDKQDLSQGQDSSPCLAHHIKNFNVKLFANADAGG